jgi:hypothetical protein
MKTTDQGVPGAQSDSAIVLKCACRNLQGSTDRSMGYATQRQYNACLSCLRAQQVGQLLQQKTSALINLTGNRGITWRQTFNNIGKPQVYQTGLLRIRVGGKTIVV